MVTWWVSTSCQVGCSPKHGSTTAPRGFSSSCRGTARGRSLQPARCACTARLNPQKSLGFSRSLACLASNLWFNMFNLRQWTHQACHCIKPTALKKWLIVPPRTGSFHETYRKWIRVEVPLCEIRRTKSGCVSISCLRVTFAYALPIVTPGFSEGDFFLAHWAHCSGLSTPS